MDGLILFLLTLLGFCIIMTITTLLNDRKNKQPSTPEQSAPKKSAEKPVEQMTEHEKQKKIRELDFMLNKGYITFAEYDVLKAKYSGEKSFADTFGQQYTMALSNKVAVDMAAERHQKQAEKAIIYSGAIGNAIGGVGGAVVGAATAAERAIVKGQELQKQQEIAKSELDEATKNLEFK